MAENSKIEWTDHTWTPVAGCDPVSPACAFCYAALMAARLEAMGMAKYAGLATRHGNLGKWTGEVTLWEAEVLKPLTVKKPARWFLTSMGDVFHKKVPFDFIDKLFAVMALADWHEFYVLTKRPEIAALYLGEHSEPDMDGISRAALAEGQAQSIYHQRTGEDPSMWLSIYWPLKNVVIGCTAEDQERADERRPHMREIAAAGWRTQGTGCCSRDQLRTGAWSGRLVGVAVPVLADQRRRKRPARQAVASRLAPGRSGLVRGRQHSVPIQAMGRVDARRECRSRADQNRGRRHLVELRMAFRQGHTPDGCGNAPRRRTRCLAGRKKARRPAPRWRCA